MADAAAGGDGDRTASVHALPDGAPDDAGLTARQRAVLDVISRSVRRRGFPPSVREIGEAVGLTSTSSVFHQLKTLEAKGYLRRDPKRPRALDVRLPGEPPLRDPAEVESDLAVPDDDERAAEDELAARREQHPDATYVPLVGRIAAGTPLLAEQAVETVFPLPRDLVGEGTLFLLSVSGDSMVDAGILDRDWVVVRQQPVAEDGDTVAAMVEGEATVKTFRRRDGHVWLDPQNELYAPIPGDDAQVLGRVVSVLRKV